MDQGKAEGCIVMQQRLSAQPVQQFAAIRRVQN